MLTAKLIDSVGKGNLTAAVDCLREGGNPNTQSRDGATAMHLAAGMGTESVRLMLEYGGDPNVRSVDGSTPLHVAAAWGDKETLQLLLHNGADPSLGDHEGQRPVDVARSEQHAACVDFLKYYTMLVAVGNDEEDLKYTAEPVDSGQNDLPPVHHNPCSAVQAESYNSSDEDNPQNLSDDYADTVSRRLSQMMRDGNSACMDVTSPSCPYISDKVPQKVGAGDRTVLQEDFCAGLLDSSDSEENGEGGLPAPTGRCHSNHCCVHKMDDSRCFASKKRHQLSSPSYSEKPESPSCSDLEASYAQCLERRMKQKYFPVLDRHGGMLDRAGASSNRHFSQECVSSSCETSHLSLPCLQRERSFDEGRVQPTLPCGLPLARHQHGSDSANRGSPSMHRCCCKHGGNFHHSLGETGNDQQEPRHQHSPKKILPPETCVCGVVHYHDQSPQHPRARKTSSCSSLKLPCSLLHQNDAHGTHRHQNDAHGTHHHQNDAHGTHRHQNDAHGTHRHQNDAHGTHRHQNDAHGTHHHQNDAHGTHRHQNDAHGTHRHQNDAHGTHRHQNDAHGTHHHQNDAHGTHRHQNDAHGTHHHQNDAHGTLSLHRMTPLPVEVRRSQSDHLTSKGGCCREGWASCPHKHIYKQSSCPPSSAVRYSPSGSRSSFTTMCVLGGPRTPPSGVFRGYGVGIPEHTDLGPQKTVWTEVYDEGRKQVSVNGSRSGHSVDSGFSENYASNLPAVVNVSKMYPHHLSPGMVQPRACYSTRNDDGLKRYKSTNEQLSNKQMSVTVTDQGSCKHSSNHDKHKVTLTDEFHWPFKLEDHTIVSSNLRSQADIEARSHSHRMEGGHLIVHSDNNKQWKSSTAKFSPKADRMSASSADSFRTCEEASEPETNCAANHASSHCHSKILPKLNSQNDVSKKTDLSAVRGKAVTEQDGSNMQASPTESLGFRISQLSESQVSLDNQSGKEGTPLIKSVNHKAVSDGQAKNHGPHTTVARNSQSSRYSWLPPISRLPDDSDLMTSDGSIMMKPDDQVMRNSDATNRSDNVSKWLENLTVSNQNKRPKEVEVSESSRRQKRMSDESFVSSVASSVKEVIYRDKENGITLIERHIPSDYSGSSGRPSIESAVSLDTEQTASYDWSDFVINDDSQTSSGSSSSFDITCGQTMNSQDAFKDSHSASFIDDDKEKGLQKNLKKDIPDQNKACSKPKLDNAHSEYADSKSRQMVIGDSSDQSSDGNDTLPIPSDLAAMSNEAIFQSLKDFGEDPGPVLPSTRQTYLHRLASLRSGRCHVALTTSQPGYSQELNRLLSGSHDTEDLARSELEMVSQFQVPDGRTWREGTIKSCFNYLLLDPRVTKNLPLRAKTFSDVEAFKVFLCAVFYIGKGKRSRPYCHLYEAISHLQSPKPKVSQKVQKILDIWSSGVGVVSLHCFQNVIPVEAYTREACMVDALGLGRLTNVKKGDYYGVASTWPTSRRRCMGSYLLHKAYHIFLSEGERQICPLDIQKGK